MSEKTIALIGNPNVGKTVIFNALTGSRAHVANWPGVTVEKKTGKMGEVLITDLPGVYSLTPTAIDDLIARNYIVEEKPKLIVDIIDSTNLERNLYLGLLLKEIGTPVIFVLNMMDSATEKKIKIDVQKLSGLLKAPVLTSVAIKDEGISELKEKINFFLDDMDSIQNGIIKLSDAMENKISKVMNILSSSDVQLDESTKRWYSIKLLENDSDIHEKLKKQPAYSAMASW